MHDKRTGRRFLDHHRVHLDIRCASGFQAPLEVERRERRGVGGERREEGGGMRERNKERGERRGKRREENDGDRM